MTPSKYQSAIYDFMEYGEGDFVVNAVAGSGKTTTLQEGVNRLPRQVQVKTWLTAFNKHIKEELEHRQSMGRIPRGVTIQTIHSQGYTALLRHFKPRNKGQWVWDGKYRRLNRLAWEMSDLPQHLRRGSEYMDARYASQELIKFCQCTLTEPTLENLAVLSAHFGVTPPPSVYRQYMTDVVSNAITWGANGAPVPDEEHDDRTYHPAETVSYSDMVYLPAINPAICMPQYSLILADEAQDLNAAQLALVMRCRAPGGRIGFVGDRHQAIYGFTGSDCKSIETIIEKTNATELPLSICYRCPRKVVELAKRLVPEIEPAENALPGVVESVSQGSLVSMAVNRYRENPQGSQYLLLCRINAPLVGTAYELVRQRVPVRITGKDIAEHILSHLEDIVEMDGYSDDEFLDWLSRYQTRKNASLAKSKNAEMLMDSLDDRLSCLRVVHDAVKVRLGRVTAGDLRQELGFLFSDSNRSGVVLSSVHKSKGLEADYVGILCPYLMPHPKAGDGWQYVQEANLAYVAITRAKKELYVAGEFGFPSLSQFSISKG